MSDIEREYGTQGWLIAPELHFSRSAKVMAQTAVINSDVFLDMLAEIRASLDKAFVDAERIFALFSPMLTDPAISIQQFRDRLPSEPMDFGELQGRKGLLASGLQKATRQAAIRASYDARRAMVALKGFHERTYQEAMRKIETARQNASIGVPELSTDSKSALEHLHSLDSNQLTQAVKKNVNHIAKIEAFHEAVRWRFGLAHKIFGQTETALTEEQRVHFYVLKLHEQEIRRAQSLVRSIALLGGDDEPLEIDLEIEWGRER